MGRKSIKNYCSEDYISDDEDKDKVELEEKPKPLWELMVIDAENELLDYTMEYERYDSRFEWLEHGRVIWAVEDILFCKPDYIDFFEIFDGPVNIENDIYDYITGVINILDLKNKPLLNQIYYEYTLIEKLTNTESNIITTTPNDPRLDSNKYLILEELVDSDTGVAYPLENEDVNRVYIYLNHIILKNFRKYFK